MQDAEFRPTRPFEAISDGDMNAARRLREKMLSRAEGCRRERRIDDDARHSASEYALCLVTRLAPFALVLVIAMLVRHRFIAPGVSMMSATAQQRVREQ